MKYIIEHLEPELFEWCLIEYRNISKMVGKENLWFTNIQKQDEKKLKDYGRVFNNSIKSMNLKNPCILDPESSIELKPKDKEKFEYFIFGGILGDYPPKKRTKKELTKFIKSETRNIGKKQFSTDNAVFVVKEILNGKTMKDLKFQNSLEIKTGKYDSIILPYYYPIINNKPKISKNLLEYIKKHQGFK